MATFSLALCVAVLVLVGAIAERVNASWVRWVGSPEPHFIVRPRGSALGWEEVARLTRGIPGVGDVTAVYSGLLTSDEIKDSGWVSVSWVGADSDEASKAYPSPGPGVPLWKGELPPSGSSDRVVLGYELARVLGLDIGDEVSVQGNPFTVGAIWTPSGSEPGNFVQVPVEAVLSRFASGSASRSHVVIYTRPESDAEEVARTIWREIPGLQVSSPGEENARLRAEAGIWRGAVILLSLWTLAVGLLGFVNAFAGVVTGEHPEPLRLLGLSAGMAVLAGVIGSVSGGLIALALNVYGQRVYARTFFFLTPRLVVLGLGIALAAGVTAVAWLLLWARVRRSYGQLVAVGRGVHWAIAILVVGVGTCLLITGGSVTESLYASLDEVRQIAVRRVGVKLLRSGGSVLPRLAIVPGVEGLTAEAYGGAVDEDEEGWGDSLPPSGVLYGVASDAGGPAMSLWHRTGLSQGRELRGGSQDEAVVGFDLAEYHDLHVGDVLTIRESEFVVVGIRQRCSYGMPGDFNWRVDVSLEALRRVTHKPYALDSVALSVPPVEREERRSAFLLDLARRVPEGRVVSFDAQVDGVAARYPLVTPLASDQQGEMARRARFMYSIGYLILGIFASLVMGCVLWTAVALDVNQRRERTALEMALGAGESNILSELTLSAASRSVLGALAGALAAWWLARLANAWIADSGIGLPYLLASPRLFVVGAAWSVVLAILVAFLPALQGLRDDPLRVLVRADIQVRRGVEP